MTAWNLRPIASALWRNRTGALLVAFQIAIGLAVLVNAVYVVKQRVDKINRPNGMDVENMIVVASAGFAKDFDYEASWREDLATMRGLPGVKAASLVSTIPLSGGAISSGNQHLILLANPTDAPREVSFTLAAEKTLRPIGQGAEVVARGGAARVRIEANGTMALRY